MSLIKLENVTKIYHTGEVPVTALKGIDLEIGKQAFVSFIGPSGNGKSTLLNLIGALDKPTQGSITINGANLGALSRKDAANFRGETLGFVFQNFNLIPVLTVYENADYNELAGVCHAATLPCGAGNHLAGSFVRHGIFRA
jgi:putative ABC transport system ATP-binding protein